MSLENANGLCSLNIEPTIHTPFSGIMCQLQASIYFHFSNFNFRFNVAGPDAGKERSLPCR